MNDECPHEFLERAQQSFIAAIAECQIGESHASVSTHQNTLSVIGGAAVERVLSLDNKIGNDRVQNKSASEHYGVSSLPRLGWQ